jgi:hypothetical protein
MNSYTVNPKRLAKRKLQRDAVDYEEEIKLAEKIKPKTWGECKRLGLAYDFPCPFISCAYSTLAEVKNDGAFFINGSLNQDTGEISCEPAQSCALAYTESKPEGGTLDDVGEVFGLTRERVRQIETVAILKATRSVRDGIQVESVDDVSDEEKKRAYAHLAEMENVAKNGTERERQHLSAYSKPNTARERKAPCVASDKEHTISSDQCYEQGVEAGNFIALACLEKALSECSGNILSAISKAESIATSVTVTAKRKATDEIKLDSSSANYWVYVDAVCSTYLRFFDNKRRAHESKQMEFAF